MPAALDYAERAALWQVVGWYSLALLFLVLALRCARPSDPKMGIGRPQHQGTRTTLIGVALSLPIGFWLVAVTTNPWGSPLSEFLQFLTVVPEHFLIFGIVATVLMPGRRLRWPQPSERQGAGAAYAMVATGIVFGLAHIGKPNVAEVVTSFPLGLLFAWMTIHSGSIWPAVIAHCTLNLIPMAVLPSGA